MRRRLVICLIAVLMTMVFGACEDLQPAKLEDPSELELPQAVLTITTQSLPNAQQGVNYNSTVVASGGQAPYAWTLSAGTLPPGLALGSSATTQVVLSGTSSITGQYSFELSIEDALGEVATRLFSLVIQTSSPGAVQIQTMSLLGGIVGQPYTASILATGGTSPYSWSLLSGSLPPGLGVAGSSGLTETISGTPTSPGTFVFTLQVTDSLFQTASRQFSLAVNSQGSLSIQTASLPTGAQGMFYQAGISATGGTGQLYVWGVLAGSIPPGLILSSTGTPATSIAGTPSVGGQFSFSIVVSDSGGNFAIRSFQVSIAGPGQATQLEITSPSSTTAGSPISVTVTAKDALGNVATGYAGTVSLVSSDGQVVLPSPHAFSGPDSGVFTFTGVELRTAGNHTVTASDGVLQVTSNSISVTSAAAAVLQISGLSGQVPLGVGVGFNLELRDGFNNLATNYQGTVGFSSSDGAASLPASYSFTVGDGGQHQFISALTFQTAGLQTFTATDLSTGSLTDTVSAIDVVTDVAPSVTTNLPPGRLSLRPGDAVAFRITVDDVLGDDVELFMTNPLPGMAFAPVLPGPGPAMRDVYWEVHEGIGGLQKLRFVARDNAVPANETVYEIEVEILGLSGNLALNIEDVTGDGLVDVVCGARDADANGVTDSGAVYVWTGQSSPSGSPDYVLTVPGAIAGDRIGNVGTFGEGHQAIQIADITGDGIADIIVGASEADISGVQNAGAIYVWRGGSSINAAPDFLLSVPGASVDDRLGMPEFGQGVLLHDVTGDGDLDVIALTSDADVGGVVDTGAIYVWRGGSGLTGSPAFTLMVPGASPNTRLGYVGGNQGVFVQDVNADGVPDIISGSRRAEVNGFSEAGALYVWRGGVTIQASPNFTLTLDAPQALDRLGEGSGRSVQFRDITGDGQLDILVNSKNRDVGSVNAVGGVFVWRGGASISQNPNWSLQPANPSGGEQLGFGSGFRVGDISGDGVDDVVGSSPNATVGSQAGAGSVYVWLGGSGLANTPDYTLHPASPVTGDSVGEIVRLVDLTGDGTLDIFSLSRSANVGAVPGAGKANVWRGGSTISQFPNFTLAAAAPAAGDRMGSDSQHFADVTGDGVADILLVSRDVDGGAQDTGAAHFWAGGATISSAPDAVMAAPGASADAGLGWDVIFGDVTGDGALDVIMRDESVQGGMNNAGALHVWAGGGVPGNSPDWSLTEAVPTVNAHLGQADLLGLLTVDVTGDGVLDLIGATRNANNGRGAVHVWTGGGALSSNPDFTLTDSTAPSFSRIGTASGQAVRLADWNADGILDVLAVAAAQDVGVTQDAGVIHYWSGLITASGDPAIKLLAPFPENGDRLGG